MPRHKVLGFTGTRKGMTSRQLEGFEILLKAFYAEGYRDFHYGDCVGSDEEAAGIALKVGFELHCHPPVDRSERAFTDRKWKKIIVYPPRPFLERNHEIVFKSDRLLATPSSEEEEVRSGTWATIRFAKKQGVKVIKLEP
jgi:hypothetical protein